MHEKKENLKNCLDSLLHEYWKEYQLLLLLLDFKATPIYNLVCRICRFFF